jgi:ferredoxin
MSAMQLHIDWTRCDGHGLCHAMLPADIHLDEWGFPLLPQAPVPASVLPDVRRVVAACPALALRLVTTTPEPSA